MDSHVRTGVEKPPHPLCPLCDMMVPWWSLNGSQNGTEQCKNGDEQKYCRLAEDEAWSLNPRYFSAYSLPLNVVISFK